MILTVFLILVLSAFDVYNTVNRISDYGLSVELNPFVRTLVLMTGVDVGVVMGVLIPTGLLILLGLYCSPVLYFVLGSKATLFLMQMKANQLVRQG